MQQMQAEFVAMQPPVDIRILGINVVGDEQYNASYCVGLSLPWLQDTTGENVWADWHAAWRDVIVLDKQNQPLLTYNLFNHDLSVPANYTELKNALLAAAQAP